MTAGFPPASDMTFAWHLSGNRDVSIRTLESSACSRTPRPSSPSPRVGLAWTASSGSLVRFKNSVQGGADAGREEVFVGRRSPAALQPAVNLSSQASLSPLTVSSRGANREGAFRCVFDHLLEIFGWHCVRFLIFVFVSRQIFGSFSSRSDSAVSGCNDADQKDYGDPFLKT